MTNKKIQIIVYFSKRYNIPDQNKKSTNIHNYNSNFPFFNWTYGITYECREHLDCLKQIYIPKMTSCDVWCGDC